LVPWCVLEKPSPEQVGDPPVLLAHPAPDARITQVGSPSLFLKIQFWQGYSAPWMGSLTSPEH
jgi:hypothetical protein